MSTTYFIYLPQKQEYVSIGQIVGWGVSGYPMNTCLGALAVLVLMRDPEGGVRFVSHEDYEYDIKLENAKNITEHYSGLCQNFEAHLAVGGRAVKSMTLVAEDGAIFALPSVDVGKQGAAWIDTSTLTDIARYFMLHRGRLIRCKCMNSQ